MQPHLLKIDQGVATNCLSKIQGQIGKRFTILRMNIIIQKIKIVV